MGGNKGKQTLADFVYWTDFNNIGHRDGGKCLSKCAQTAKQCV